MSVFDQLDEVIRKKAFGFSYTEETKDYESGKVKNLLFCHSRRRMFILNRGFVRVSPIYKQGEIVGVKKFPTVNFACKTKAFGGVYKKS